MPGRLGIRRDAVEIIECGVGNTVPSGLRDSASYVCLVYFMSF